MGSPSSDAAFKSVIARTALFSLATIVAYGGERVKGNFTSLLHYFQSALSVLVVLEVFLH